MVSRNFHSGNMQGNMQGSAQNIGHTFVVAMMKLADFLVEGGEMPEYKISGEDLKDNSLYKKIPTDDGFNDFCKALDHACDRLYMDRLYPEYLAILPYLIKGKYFHILRAMYTIADISEEYEGDDSDELGIALGETIFQHQGDDVIAKWQRILASIIDEANEYLYDPIAWNASD